MCSQGLSRLLHFLEWKTVLQLIGGGIYNSTIWYLKLDIYLFKERFGIGILCFVILFYIFVCDFLLSKGYLRMA